MQQDFEFIDISGGAYQLGWRFSNSIPPEAKKSINTYHREYVDLHFSKQRWLTVGKFSIAKTTIALEDLVNEHSDEIYEVDNFAEFCLKLDGYLNQYNLRLPTEDEFEIACGGQLFWWGNGIPQGIPFVGETNFEEYKQQNSRGLLLNSDIYKMEIVKSELKLGDGGEALCGGYPWPIAWLALCPSHRIPHEMLNAALFEMLESVQVRPVLLGKNE